MSSFIIDKDIPLPPPRDYGPPQATPQVVWPWGLMEVGDSVLIPAKFVKAGRQSLAAFRKEAPKPPPVFVSKKNLDKSIRVWRKK